MARRARYRLGGTKELVHGGYDLSRGTHPLTRPFNAVLIRNTVALELII